MTVRLPQREIRRSFILGVVNGALFEFAERLIDPPLVLTWFVSRLTPSNLLVGLVAPLGDAGWSLPQVFISGLVQRMPRKMLSYTLAAVVRVASWLLLALAVGTVEDPSRLLVTFFVLYGVARLAAGLGGLGFFEVVAKTIPAQRRGRFFAWRMLTGGLLGLGAGGVTREVLNRCPFPHGHALLFGIYTAVIVPAMLAFILIREPPGTAYPRVPTLGQQLRQAGSFLRTNAVFRRYMGVRTALGLAGIALPFYGVYARNVLGAPEGMVGIYVAVRVAAGLIANLPWGLVSDRRGNRLVTLWLSLGHAFTAGLALVLVGWVALFPSPDARWPYLAIPLFLLNGALAPASALVGANFLLELVPEAERPLYLGLSNTLIGLVVLISGLGGLVVDLLGFAGLFGLSTVLCLLAWWWARRLPEPRVGSLSPGAEA
ncbi:MAG: MFS transporter [Anaerolineae bacterium]|nr:MFS transporter [Anaerolineae bacterium]MDW8067382.1 MFS transporter [Anaerolineae bacterium]